MKITKNIQAMLLATVTLLLGTSRALAQSSANYDLSRNTVDGGGATSASAGYGLNGTIGQPDAGGEFTSSSYSLTGGLWPAAASDDGGSGSEKVYLPLILKNY
jgi:hypothetical protein